MAETKNSQSNTQQQSTKPNIVFSISVLDDGSVIVTENGSIITRIIEVSFQAKKGSLPVYSFSKIPNIKQ